MDILLRKLAEWRGRRKAAQVIVFDGGAEVERTRSFLKGAVTGSVLALLVFALSAPSTTDAEMVEKLRARGELVTEANDRLEQAVLVADMCLSTAERLEETLNGYQAYLGGKTVP